MVGELREKEGLSIVLVSHSMEDVAEYAERLIVIDEGEIKYDDEPRKVFAHADELRKMGLEIPQCTELMGKLADAGLNVDRSCLTVEEAVNSIIGAIS